MTESAESDPHRNKPTFEDWMWRGRWFMLLAAIVSFSAAVVLFGYASFSFIKEIMDVAATPGPVPKGTLLVMTIKLLDSLLVCAIAVVIGFGLYVLFVSDLDVKESEGGKILKDIKDVGVLEHKLGSVAIILLIVRFVGTSFPATERMTSTRSLLEFAAAIALVALALYLQGASRLKHREAIGRDRPETEV